MRVGTSVGCVRACTRASRCSIVRTQRGECQTVTADGDERGRAAVGSFCALGRRGRGRRRACPNRRWVRYAYSTSRAQRPRQDTILLPLPLGEGGGEGLPDRIEPELGTSPHPNPLPKGEGTVRRI